MDKRIVEKYWSHLVSKYIWARKDFRYAWNLRHETEGNVDWLDTIPARIADIKMVDLQFELATIHWRSYGLGDPKEYAKQLLRLGY